MKRYLPWICLALAFIGGIFAGWVDFNNDEPQATMLVILVVTFLLGMILPGKAWLWAIIVSVCIPGMYLFMRSQGYLPASPPSPAWYTTLFLIIPTLISAYIGALARVIFNNSLAKTER